MANATEESLTQQVPPLRAWEGLTRLVRPLQWIKNGFVFMPLIFARAFSHMAAIESALIAAALFCIAASTVYIVNDIHDAPQDSLHPAKLRKRPIANGSVSVRAALILLFILYGVLAAGCLIAPAVMPVILAYVALNYAYSFFFKSKAIVDIFIIAIGFVMRVYAGGVAVHVPVSHWMLITTLCIALYLASVKRLQELRHGDARSRAVLKHYSPRLLERYAEMSASAAIIFYSLFVIEVRPRLAFTVPVVLFGIFRYWYVVEKFEGGESPTDALFADWPLLATVVIWTGGCVLALMRW